jgi:pimeloyl-ACP methyl ester carboxylesterase
MASRCGAGGREITAAYARYGTPLKALAAPVPTLDLYGQPSDPGYLAAQEAFAAQHPWFQVRRLEVRSHFPTIEARAEVVEVIDPFL